MARRIITRDQALRCLAVLCEECRWRPGQYDGENFVRYITGVQNNALTEWRFQGALGFGGKFRNNGNHDTPYVDCYGEDETPARLAMIERANRRLAEIFALEGK